MRISIVLINGSSFKYLDRAWVVQPWPIGRILSRVRFGFVAIAFGAATLIFAGIPSIAQAGSISYAYDAAGRLTCVYNGAGQGVNYNYDAVGNLLSITAATGCAQNTMRSVKKTTAVASSNQEKALQTRRASNRTNTADALSETAIAGTNQPRKTEPDKNALKVSLR